MTDVIALYTSSLLFNEVMWGTGATMDSVDLNKESFIGRLSGIHELDWWIKLSIGQRLYGERTFLCGTCSLHAFNLNLVP